jgi:NitT/TauT family transport system ATP-binding protein
MADRIMILGRRPARIRAIVAVPISRAGRKEAAAERQLQALHDRLWSGLREDALIADREASHG